MVFAVLNGNQGKFKVLSKETVYGMNNFLNGLR